jgi:hypothetical protein
MKNKKIKFDVEINLKELNQFLALIGDDIITSDEELEKWQNLKISTDDLPDLNSKLSVAAFLVTAKETN